MSRKEVMRGVRKGRDELAKELSQILWDGVEVRRRSAAYSEQVLNVEDVTPEGSEYKCS